MVQGAQYSGVRPTGLKKKKKNRFAPVIQEQARQGLATKQVMADKSAAFEQEQFDVQKQQHSESIALQREQFAQQQKVDQMNQITGGISTAVEIAGLFF